MENTKLLSATLIADDYLETLKWALDRAEFARFVVCYVSDRGIKAIGHTRIVEALRHDLSFGVASLACATGFNPLFELQNKFGLQEPRLKYFLDPCKRKDRGEPVVSLVHSKLAYIKVAGEDKAIILIGSHNWSGAALGGRDWTFGRNVESSLFVEVPFIEGHIDGSSDDLGGEVNRHLLSCWKLHSCLVANRANLPKFEQWMMLACESPGSEKLEEIVVILAVNSMGKNASSQWTDLKGSSIYAQIYRESPDGELLWKNGNAGVVILLWETSEELRRSTHPVLIFCHVSTFNATPSSSVGSSNASGSPVEGFKSVLRERTTAEFVRSRPVEYYEFDRAPIANTAAGIDGSHEPNYRFLLEVDQVVLPKRMADHVQSAGLPFWEPGDLAFAEKDRIHPEKASGYFVDSDLCGMIKQEFSDIFRLQPKNLKVGPVDKRYPREGLRISRHDLHCTFVSDEDVEAADEFYLTREVGDLVPEVKIEQRQNERSKLVPRTSRVFMHSVKTLMEKWTR